MTINFVHTALILLALATVIVAISPRLKMPIEVLLILGSLLLSLVPGLPAMRLNPDLVFTVFLPPIIFGAAYFTSWRDFKANKRPIALLAIGLVLFTTLTTAVIVHALIPSLPWAVGFLLGAMISPPDAAAATAITRRLGVPRRLLTIIEGESLVNDATALVAYKFAIAAILTGAFSLRHAVIQFFVVSIGGIGVGLAVGWIGIALYRRLLDRTAQILVSFLTAFAAYLAAETLHMSGVMATVVAGLYFGRWIPMAGSAQLRIEAKAGWDLILFIINALVFTFIGFQLPVVLGHLEGYSAIKLARDAAVITLAVIALRFIWVYPATYLPRLLVPSIRQRDPAPSWKAVFVLSWTGMRGIVSLAAALALPFTLPSGDPFPDRNLLIFLTYVVILATLLIPSLTLPMLMRLLQLQVGDDQQREELVARLAGVRAVLDNSTEFRQNTAFNPEHVDQLVHRYKRRLETLQANMTDSAFSPLYDEDAQRRRLLREAIRRERQALIQLRDDGQIHNEVVHLILRELDLEEMRLRTQRV